MDGGGTNCNKRDLKFTRTWIMKTGLVAIIVALLCVAPAIGQDKKEKITFVDHIAPIFKQRCSSCHNTNKKEADLDVTNFTALMQGGGSGAVIEPGDSGASYLFALVTHADEPAMPPDSDKIPAAEITLLQKWIDGGALETKSSVAKIKPKKKFDFALEDATSGRPSVVAMPARLLLQPEIVGKRTTATTAIATSPWAPLVAVAGQKQVLIYNTKTLELAGILPFPEGQINVLKFSRTGALLLAAGGRAGDSGKAVLFNVIDGSRITEVGDELDAVLAADISPDHRQIAIGSSSKLIRIYSTEDQSLQFEIKKHTEWVTSMEFSPDGVLLATGDRNGGVHVWEAFTGRPYLSMKGHSKMITGISWRGDSNIFATGSEDTTIKLWELENGGQIKTWGAHGGGVSNIEFARDGRIVSCGRDRVAKVYDQNGAQKIVFSGLTDIATRVSVCDETNRLIVGDWNGNIKVFNAADGKPVGVINSNPTTIENRLVALRAELEKARAAKTTTETAFNVATKSATDTKARLTASQNALNAANAQVPQLTKAIATYKTTITQKTNEKKTLDARLAQLTKGLPLLKDSSAKANAAAAQVPDKEMKDAAAKVAALLTQRTAEMNTGKKTQAALAKMIADNNVAMKKANADLAVAKKTIQTSTATVNQLTKQIAPLDQKVAAAKQAFDAAKAQVPLKVAAVDNLNGALVFAKQFKSIHAKIKAATELMEEKFTSVEERKLELVGAEKIVSEKKSAFDAANAKVAEIAKLQQTRKAEMDAAIAAKANLQKQITAHTNESAMLTKVVPSLDAILKQLEETIKLTPNDSELKNHFVSTKTIADKRKARQTELPKLIAADKTKMPEMDKAITTAQTNLNAANTAMKTAQQTATAMKTAFDAEAQKANVVKATITTAQSELDKANATIDALNTKLKKLQGIDL